MKKICLAVLTFLGVNFLLCSSTNAALATLESYELFVDNVNANRVLDQGDFVLEFNITSSPPESEAGSFGTTDFWWDLWRGVRDAFRGIGMLLLNKVPSHHLTQPTFTMTVRCGVDDGNVQQGLLGSASGNYGDGIDPQDSWSFCSFKVDGVEIIDELVAYALQPENVMWQTELPDFFGGTTFTATSAFSACITDDNGIETSLFEIGFAVFETPTGAAMGPIIFVPDLGQLPQLLDMSIGWDFSPVTDGLEGDAVVVGASFFAYEKGFEPMIAIPEPTTLLLLGLGGLGLLRKRRMRGRKIICTR